MYTIENSNKRDDRMYGIRKTRSQQSSRQLHRAICVQPEYLTPAEKLAIYRWLRTVPAILAEPRLLKIEPSSTLYTKHCEHRSSEALCGNWRGHSNVQRRYTNESSGVGADTGNARLIQSETRRQMLQQRMLYPNTRTYDHSQINVSRNGVKCPGCVESQQLSPGTERDAEHESIGEESTKF
jgi:hypothetical protein